MGNPRVQETVRKVKDVVLDYGPDRLRLLLRVMRTLAKGRPVTREQVDQIITNLGIDPDEAHRFLEVTERDAHDNIVGILGLSLNDHPHRVYVSGVSLSTWCAEDSLYMPVVLNQTATIESDSPLSKEKVRLTVSPDKVEAVSPAGAVVSMVIVDPTQDDMASVAAIWSAFCHNIFFFASRAEAARWAAGREDIEIISVAEGFEFVQEAWLQILAYAE